MAIAAEGTSVGEATGARVANESGASVAVGASVEAVGDGDADDDGDGDDNDGDGDDNDGDGDDEDEEDDDEPGAAGGLSVVTKAVGFEVEVALGDDVGEANGALEFSSSPAADGAGVVLLLLVLLLDGGSVELLSSDDPIPPESADKGTETIKAKSWGPPSTRSF